MFDGCLLLILLSLFVFMTTCFGTIVSDCGSKGELNYIHYTGCKNSSEDVCHLERGSNGTLTVEFTPVEQVYSMTVKAAGILNGWELPLTVKNPDACLEKDITCPVPANANQIYSTDVKVMSLLPKLSAEVRWQIQDQANNDIVCVKFPVQIC